MISCEEIGHSPRVVGAPGEYTSGYVCSVCGAWKRRYPPELNWHSWEEPCPEWGLPLDSVKDALAKLAEDGERYRFLRAKMGANREETWKEVEELAAICCYIGYEAFDATIDASRGENRE